MGNKSSKMRFIGETSVKEVLRKVPGDIDPIHRKDTRQFHVNDDTTVNN